MFRRSGIVRPRAGLRIENEAVSEAHRSNRQVFNPSANPPHKKSVEDRVKAHLNAKRSHEVAAKDYGAKWKVLAGAAMCATGALAVVGVPCLLISLGGYLKNRYQAHRAEQKAQKAMRELECHRETKEALDHNYDRLNHKVDRLREACKSSVRGDSIWKSAKRHIDDYIRTGSSESLVQIEKHIRFAGYSNEHIQYDIEINGQMTLMHPHERLVLNHTRPAGHRTPTLIEETLNEPEDEGGPMEPTPGDGRVNPPPARGLNMAISLPPVREEEQEFDGDIVPAAGYRVQNLNASRSLENTLTVSASIERNGE